MMASIIWTAGIFGLLFTRGALGGLYTDPSLLANSTYDFVIVGAGTAGNVLASRLTECRFSVLVIEAGPSFDTSQVGPPLLAPELSMNASITWGYTTVPQPGLNGRELQYPRGRIVGGSSAINYMFYTRGTRDDFDRIARHSGDNGWSWNSLLPFVLKSERLVKTINGLYATGRVNPQVHGNGPVQVSLSPTPIPLDELVVNTTQILSAEFPYNVDMNSGNQIGVGWGQWTFTDKARRVSSATAYLNPALDRTNLDVLTNTYVTKLIRTGTNNGKPVIKKVEFTAGPNAQRFTATARHEVILSAGATNTPQLLLLSGIGASAQLAAHNIPAVADLPAVGTNLVDHIITCVSFKVNNPTFPTYDTIFQNATLMQATRDQWLLTGGGPFANGVAKQIGWLRVPGSDPIWSEVPVDPSAGPTSGHVELFFTNNYSPNVGLPPPPGNYISPCVSLVSPSSVGSIKLRSSDPFATPLIDPAHLTTKFDVYATAYGLRALFRFHAASPWAPLNLTAIGAFTDPAAINDDAAVESYIRSSVQTIFHPVGTAKIAKKNTRDGVVDNRLRVLGVEGLRIVDASVFPFVPAAHTQAPVYAIAERAASLIRADYD